MVQKIEEILFSFVQLKIMRNLAIATGVARIDIWIYGQSKTLQNHHSFHSVLCWFLPFELCKNARFHNVIVRAKFRQAFGDDFLWIFHWFIGVFHLEISINVEPLCAFKSPTFVSLPRHRFCAGPSHLLQHLRPFSYQRLFPFKSTGEINFKCKIKRKHSFVYKIPFHIPQSEASKVLCLCVNVL